MVMNLDARAEKMVEMSSHLLFFFARRSVSRLVKRLDDLSKGLASHELEAITLHGLQVVHARRGHFLYRFIVPSRISDSDGNWHVGAMATLVDVVSAIAVNSVSGQAGSVSVDYSISFYSAAKIQEEIEIEAKVVGRRERLFSVVVEVRRKQNGDLVALGKQWMSPTPSGRNLSKL